MPVVLIWLKLFLDDVFSYLSDHTVFTIVLLMFLAIFALEIIGLFQVGDD